MKKFILYLVTGYAAFAWYQDYNTLDGSLSTNHDQLIMYSLTTCGYCKQKSRELRKENIPFTEYFIDKDTYRKNELSEKLKKAGFKPKSYGTPIFDAYGIMLPNNPDISKLKDAKAKT